MAMVRKSFEMMPKSLQSRSKLQKFAYSKKTDAAGMDRTYLGGIERGERNLALRNIEMIAVTQGVSISELTDGP